jgi:PiT family inorganic phosphate transporter
MLTALVISFIALLSYANGANDVSKGIATLIGSRVTSYKRAIAWGTIWTIAGGIVAAFFALELVKTFTAAEILKSTANLDQFLPLSVSLGAFVWIICATRIGLPVSTTHAIIGAICGVGIAAVGINEVGWAVLGKKIFLPLVLSPILALSISWIFSPLIQSLSSRAERYCLCLEVRDGFSSKPVMVSTGIHSTVTEVPPLPQAMLMAAEKNACSESLLSPIRFEVLDLLHWLSAGMTSFARGLNDAPKIVALALGASALETQISSITSFLLVALAMGLGSILSGLKVTETLAEKVTPMNPQEGFSANLTTSVLVGIAARFGLPVSTTHVSGGAIIGIGLKRGSKTVKWRIVLEMIMAWLITLPISGLIGFSAFWILNRIS